MRILILNWRDTRNPKSGGAEIVTLEHSKFWVKKGNEVVWFTSKFKNCKNEEKIEGVNIVRRGNYLSVFFHAFIFYSFSKQKFDVVIDEIHGIPFFTPLYVRVPKVAFIHEVAKEIWDYMYPFPINRLAKALEPLFFIPYRNQKFITVSLSTKNDLLKLGIKEKNIIICFNGINIKALKSLPLKEKDPTFIFVSRVVKMKGIEEVIRAFFYILKELKNANLWIVGDGEKDYIEELKETMRDYSIISRVKFFGYVDEARKIELMRGAHLLLHASVREGWGLVVTEAASQATPAVVYDVSGLRDSVKNGKTGIVLNENTGKEMAKEAIKLLENTKKYKELQENCLSMVKELSWENAVKKSLRIIESL